MADNIILICALALPVIGVTVRIIWWVMRDGKAIPLDDRSDDEIEAAAAWARYDPSDEEE